MRRTNFGKSSRPVSEEESVPIQSIVPLTIVVYNPKNVSPVEFTVSMESDTSDEDQQVEENLDDEDTSNVVGNKNDEENLEDGEVPDAEEIPNVEENPTVEKIHLVQKQNLKKSMWIHLLLKFLLKPRVKLLLVRQNVKR